MVCKKHKIVGWEFDLSDSKYHGCTSEPMYGARFLKDLYFKANSTYEGRFTVPVLWDKFNETIVNNESSDICKFFNCEFDDLDGVANINLIPEGLNESIKYANNWIYDELNNGVYKAGFATSQNICILYF